MERARSAAVERVRVALAAAGMPSVEIRFFEESTATAVEAAAAVGTQVERIVKSLVFMADDEPILVLVSGPNRVDTRKLAARLRQRVDEVHSEGVAAPRGESRAEPRADEDVAAARGEGGGRARDDGRVPAIKRATADQVLRATGFHIGGVPPIGHPRPLATFMDRDLLTYDQVWAAAGTPNAVFSIEPHHLARLTGAVVVDLAEQGR